MTLKTMFRGIKHVILKFKKGSMLF